jgi:hypothetical protein
MSKGEREHVKVVLASHYLGVVIGYGFAVPLPAFTGFFLQISRFAVVKSSDPTGRAQSAKRPYPGTCRAEHPLCALCLSSEPLHPSPVSSFPAGSATLLASKRSWFFTTEPPSPPG